MRPTKITAHKVIPHGVRPVSTFKTYRAAGWDHEATGEGFDAEEAFLDALETLVNFGADDEALDKCEALDEALEDLNASDLETVQDELDEQGDDTEPEESGLRFYVTVRVNVGA